MSDMENGINFLVGMLVIGIVFSVLAFFTKFLLFGRIGVGALSMVILILFSVVALVCMSFILNSIISLGERITRYI